MLRLIVLSFVLNHSLAQATFQPKCYPTQADFRTACEQDLKGVVDGSRCFFIGGVGNWETGWNVCRQSGSQMAHLHTESESNKVLEYLKARLGSPVAVLIALRDQSSIPIPDGQCQIDLNYAMWYDNETGPNVQLKVGNTWLRYNRCADKIPNRVPKCFLIWHSDNPDDLYIQFPYAVGDTACENSLSILCQFNNKASNFTRTSVCLTETAVETAMVNGPADCGDICTNRGWCRSFNYITTGSTNTCQLFTWSIHDNCPNCAARVAGSESCAHYNYVP